VKGAPHQANGEKVLVSCCRDEGQRLVERTHLAAGSRRDLAADVAAKFLPASEYARAKDVDFAKMRQASAFGEEYLRVKH